MLTSYIDDRVTFKVRAKTNISYVVIRKDLPTFESCNEYLDSVYNGRGSIIASSSNKTIQIYSPLEKDIVKVYCQDPRCIYDIYGLFKLETEERND